MTSWKTTLGGILGAVGLAMKHDQRTAPYADVVSAIGIALIGLAARDHNVSSEAAGIKLNQGAPEINKPKQ